MQDYSWSCFASQQSAEKAIKALYDFLGGDGWGHSIVKLLKELPDIFFRSPKPVFVDQGSVLEEFRRIALELCRRNKNVKTVYLFGSYAHGNAGSHSDADILVILFADTRSLMERLNEFILEFSNGPIPADVLVYTENELDRALKEGNLFLRKAISGILLN